MAEARRAYWSLHSSPEERLAHRIKVSAAKTKHGIRQGRQYVFVPGKGQVARYRVAIEEFLGRPLNDDEVIHHIDGDPLNDELANLQVLTQAEHAALHGNKRTRGKDGRYT